MERELEMLREEKERELNALGEEKRENEQVRWRNMIIRYTVV